MIFAAPLALIGLLALPAIVFLLRLNPPAPRRVRFPPLVLLRDIAASAPAPRHIPPWLLVLRLAAAALVILGLARPILNPPPALPGAGPILLVIDNGWATAADWPARRAAARRILAAAAARPVILLATAANAAAPPRPTSLLSAAAAAQIVEALQPEPWPSDRLADQSALQAALQAAPAATRIYLADGIADGPGFAPFLRSLAPDRVIAAPTAPSLLRATAGNATRLVIHVDNAPGGVILARAADNAVLATAAITPDGHATLALPPPLAAHVSSLALAGSVSAATTFLLDAASRAVLVGLAAGASNADTPFLGPLYFIRRALPPGAAIAGPLSKLIALKPGLIILADLPLSPRDRAAATRYITQGGVLLRFAGPLTAAAADPLSPDPLLPGDRRLGGALTWSAPQPLSTFPAGSLLAGLSVNPSITVSRQLLADPASLAAGSVWASLADGTPLVLAQTIGKGELVFILTSANADWSNLALSGLYPAILARIAGLASGAVPRTAAPVPLRSQLSAFGALTAPTAPASLAPDRLATSPVSSALPAGLYGDGATVIALNLGGHVPPPDPVGLPRLAPLTVAPPATNIGTILVVVAILLLAADLLISLRRRGLLVAALAIPVLISAQLSPARAQNAALQPSLGYIRTGDAATDQVSADGLGFLSTSVATQSSANLAAPTSLDPAHDDLSLYPLIYWPILAATPAPAPAACAALDGYMTHGGLLVIDTDGGEPNSAGSGAGLAPGTQAAFARATACLNLPPLQPLAGTDVLAHCFYILHGFSGRFTGAPVLAATPAGRDDDGVSPVIVGQNGWAAAWARDQNGIPEQLPLPGGEDQREAADRFGTNLVIYALTGSYKADQTNITALLDKLRQ